MTTDYHIEGGRLYPTDLVDSGNYIVSRKQKLVLTALLGTCVGVTIVDRNAGVGGLFHILLPEPTGTAEYWEPLNYASTGTSMFIQALILEGAEIKNMRANIAGGALVGPISLDDLQLDIGGRSVECLVDILKKAGIIIESSETGGYFSCRMNLDLSTLDSEVKPIQVHSQSDEKSVESLSAENIEEAIRIIRPIPQIALKIIRLINSDDYNMNEIAGEIRQDQVMSAKVLNICNSAFYSPAKKVDNINRALVLLGEKQILQIVMSSSMDELFRTSDKGYSLVKGGLFKHSMGTALVSQRLAAMTDKINPDVAYTAGLLHDIGKVVLDQSIDQIVPQFYRRLYSDKTQLVDVEKEFLGIGHTEVGAKLAELWMLPDNLKAVISFHHSPEDSKEHSELVHIVYLANLLVSRFQVGRVLTQNSTDRLGVRLKAIGLDIDNFTEIIDHIPWKTIESQIW